MLTVVKFSPSFNSIQSPMSTSSSTMSSPSDMHSSQPKRPTSIRPKSQYGVRAQSVENDTTYCLNEMLAKYDESTIKTGSKKERSSKKKEQNTWPKKNIVPNIMNGESGEEEFTVHSKKRGALKDIYPNASEIDTFSSNHRSNSSRNTQTDMQAISDSKMEECDDGTLTSTSGLISSTQPRIHGHKTRAGLSREHNYVRHNYFPHTHSGQNIPARSTDRNQGSSDSSNR